MSDTPDHVRAAHQAALMQMSPVERLMAAAGMYEAARAMVLASLPRDARPEEIVNALLWRMYGEELREETRRAVVARAGG